LPENLESFFDEKIISDFNQVKGILTSLEKRFSEKTGNWMYIYGLTNRKELADIFESFHDMKLFTRVEKKVTKEEYELLRKENIDAVLDWRNIDEEYVKSKNSEDSLIVCNKIEYCDFQESFQIYLDDILMETSVEHYDCFNDEFIEALDKLFYCTENRINGCDADYYRYNLSFGCTAEGYISSRASIIPNYLSLYTKLYALLLRKD
jgi:hypothetical protein